MIFPWQKNRIDKKNNEALIEELKIEGITENNVLYAIKKVPREIFVERQFIQQAYENIPLPIDCNQTISQPYVVAYMISCLNLKNTDKVLEIGCGWGGFAEYVGKNHDVKLDCITISKKQFEYASNRIFKNGLNEKINIQFKDYRDVKQKYNSIASIEMIEAVGQNYLENYFKTIKTNLVRDGSAAIQAITIDDNLFDRYKTKEDFIQKYIFPGGFLPSKKKLYDLSQNNGLAINQYNSYGLHYSNTLKIWRDEFFKKWEEISKQGFDNKFKRMWHFYLSYCEAGFKSKNIDLIQFSLQNR